jgi:hypothetical protein
MATPDPYWTDGHWRRLPPQPCPWCGAQPYTVQSYQSWCGHRQEIIPFPRADGKVLFVPVLGEATYRMHDRVVLRAAITRHGK